MSTPYTFSGTLVYPPDDGQPAVARPFSVSGQYDVKAEFDYDLLGGGTQVVDFGSVSDAKAIQIEVAADAQAPVVAEEQHLRKCHQAQHHALATHEAGHGGHHHRDRHGLHRHPAAQVAGEDGHRVEQVLGDPRLLEDGGHQHEEGHRHQRIALQQPEGGGR